MNTDTDPRPEPGAMTASPSMKSLFGFLGTVLECLGEAIVEADEEQQREKEKKAQDPFQAPWDPGHPDYLLWRNRK